MTLSRQGVLDLDLAPALDREDFLAAPGNAEALAWVDRWPRWPSPVLLLYGPAGCGKSHLGEIWQRRARAVTLLPEQLHPDRLPELLPDLQRGGSAVIVDGIEAVAGEPRRERALFHLVNLIHQTAGHLLGLAGSAPALWPLGLPDLRSRLLAAPAVAIAPPDDALLAAMLVKQFADRRLQPRSEVIDFLVTRTERSYDSVRRLVARIDREALARHQRITLPLVRSVIAAAVDLD
ncbi:MAG: DNA replication protein [Azospirillum sp.]|nr:DNA replication protein [Azospirillum sp.]